MKRMKIGMKSALRAAALTGATVGVAAITSSAQAADFSAEADFLLVNLDALQQHLLAIDREDPELAQVLVSLHPYVLRALSKACEVVGGAGRELSIFGVSAQKPENLPLLIGCGLRRFALSPAVCQDFLAALDAVDSKLAARAARASSRSTSLSETRFRSLAEFRHGYARPS